MASKRRACTEAADQYDQEDEYDLDELSDQQPQQDGDEDNIDLQNYKGIYANDDAGQKYQCPETGAHFEPTDLCKRLVRMYEKRQIYVQQIDAQRKQERSDSTCEMTYQRDNQHYLVVANTHGN